MGANRQRFGDFLTTSRTYQTRIMGWNFDYLTGSAFRLLRQESKEHAPRTIRYGLAQMFIFNHTLNVKVFNINGLKIVYVVIGNFMQKIFTLIRHLLVRFSNKKSCLTSFIRALLFSTKASLPASQKFFGFSKVFRIF